LATSQIMWIPAGVAAVAGRERVAARLKAGVVHRLLALVAGHEVHEQPENK
jgi:hypothetical protein